MTRVFHVFSTKMTKKWDVWCQTVHSALCVLASGGSNDLLGRIHCEMGCDAAQRCFSPSGCFAGLCWLLPACPPTCLLHLLQRLHRLHRSLFHVHLITSSFLWLSFLWIRSHWEFAALNYGNVIREAWAPTLWCSSRWSVPMRLVPYQRRLLRFTGVALQ